jgi:hypothetical protein
LVTAACGGDDAPEREAVATTTATSLASAAHAGEAVGAAAGDAGQDGTGPATSGPGTAPPTTSPSVTEDSPAGGCGAPGRGIPAGGDAAVGFIADVDADGAEDRGWLRPTPGGYEMGVATAAGGGDTALSALPGAQVSLLVADADGRPPVELFTSDGDTAELWAFTGCDLQPVIGPDGAPFQFDLGTRGNGTGVGCVEIGGRPELVGLNVTDDDGTTVSWRRTIIELDGLDATIGPSDSGTFVRPADADGIALLHTVTCHDATFDTDGIHSG